LCTDPHVVGDDRLVSLEAVLEESDVLIIGAPHTAYASLQTTKPVMDVWNLLGQGVRI
jgi:UDP-N-acetyl-D-mannosaminuronic acid dehydrogenase